MEDDAADGWLASLDVSADATRTGRARCERCGRPAAQDCLCPALPAVPLDALGAVVILQHPNEHTRTLATVPLLTAALKNIWVVRCREYRKGRQPALDAVLAAARRPDNPLPLFVLWPGATARDAAAVGTELAAAHAAARAVRAAEDLAARPADEKDVAARVARCAYALVLPDGTWQQAGEMIRPLTAALCPPGTLVRLPHNPDDNAAAANAAMLRVEPAPGCMVTAEAVARALGALEGGGVEGNALRDALIAPAKLLLQHQLRRDPAGKGVRPTRRDKRLHLAA